MASKLDKLEFNETINSSEIIPGLEFIMGENMKFVGKSYSFVGDNNVLQTIQIWAEGFDVEDYEQD